MFTNITFYGVTNARSLSAKGVLIKNCVFSGEYSDVTKYVPIYAYDTGRNSGHTSTISVQNCEFKCSANNYINFTSPADKIELVDNVFGGDGYYTNHHNVNLSAVTARIDNPDPAQVKVTITGNKFYNWNSKKYAIASGHAKGPGEFVAVTVTGNTFSNTSDHNGFNADSTYDSGVLELKTNQYSATNSALIFSGNTYLNALSTYTDATAHITVPSYN